MVEIRLYGKLRRYIQGETRPGDNVLRLDSEPDETLDMILARLQIPVGEIYSIFFNSKLLAARSGMASWIGYRQVNTDPFEWKLDIPLTSGDRIGLFGRDMAALVI